MPHAHRPSRGSRWPTPPPGNRPPAHPAYPGPRASASAGAPGRRPRRGFTIVELLVTISIVAVLLSLLAPAIRSTIGASRGFTRNETLRTLPQLRAEGLRGSVRYFDALTNDAARSRGLFQDAEVHRLMAAPNDDLTPLRGNRLWQLGLLELWLQTRGI